MKTLFYQRFIERLLSLPDYNSLVKVGTLLNTTRQRVNDFKYGGVRATAEECEIISKTLGISFEEVFLTQSLDKAKTQSEREILENYITKHQD